MARGVDAPTADLLRTWIEVTYTLISTGHAQFLYQALETAYATQDLSSEDWLLLNYLRDPTVTLSPATISNPSTFDTQLTPEGHPALASQTFGDEALASRDCALDVSWDTEFGDGHSLGASWPTSPGSVYGEGGDGGDEHMMIVPAPEGSSYELPSLSDPHSSSSSYAAKQLLFTEDTPHHNISASSDEGSTLQTIDSMPFPSSLPQPMCTNLHEHSIPNSKYVATDAERNAESLSDAGSRRPTAATKPAPQTAKNTKTRRRKQKKKHTETHSIPN